MSDSNNNNSSSDAGKQGGDSLDETLSLIRALAGMVGETGLSGLKFERDGLRISLSRQVQTMVAGPVAVPTALEPAPAKTETEAPPPPDLSKHPGVVKSPMVGTVYLSPEPGAPTYVKRDDEVKAGQTLLVVEAMKTFNAVTAPRSGKLTLIMAGDGQPVEYGEPLVIIE